MAELTFGGGLNELADQDANFAECIIGENFELQVGNQQYRPRKPNDLKVRAGENRLLESETFENASWTQNNISVVTNPPAIITPRNDTTSEQILETAVNGAHSLVQGAISVIENFEYTLSIYVRHSGRDFLRISVSEGVTSHEAYFNILTGVTGTSSNITSSSISLISNSFYRCNITFTSNTTDAAASVNLNLASADGVISYLGVITNGLYLWGAQLEQSALLSSYVPTTSAIVTGKNIAGILQLEKRDNTNTTIIIAGTNVYLWDGTNSLGNPIATVTTGGRFRDAYWSLDDIAIITDVLLQNQIKQWNGTAFSNLTTGTGNAIRAKYAIIHNGRVWLANIIDGTTALPHVILVSAFENHELYDPGMRAGTGGFTGDEAFFLTTPDLRPVNGLDIFQQEVIISTEQGRIFKVTGNDSTNYAFLTFYAGSAAIGTQSLRNIGNDTVYLRTGGVVESLVATETSGDVTANDISIKVPVSFNNQDDAIVIYDQTLQKVYFFVTGKVMVLFKDMLGTELSPWSVYKTQHSSQFNATAAKYMRIPGQSDFTSYWGDVDGNIFDMNGEGAGDAGVDNILTRRVFQLVNMNWGPPFQFRLQYRQKSATPVMARFSFGDEIATRDVPITLKAATTSTLTRNFYNADSHYNNEAYYSEGQELGALPVTQGGSPAGRGIAAFLELRADTRDDFLIDKIILGDDAIANQRAA